MLGQAIFEDRQEAGRLLADLLGEYGMQPDVLVLALPRGGVPVAYEISKALNAPLDVFVVRKLGVPGHEELAMGALAPGGIKVLNEGLIHQLRIPEEAIARVVALEKRELEARERRYRPGRPPVDARGRIIILVDDGLATGSTMRAAVVALRRQNPGRIVVAVPVGADESCHELWREADQVICHSRPKPFFAVGSWYRHFEQTGDEEVREFLERAALERSPRN